MTDQHYIIYASGIFVLGLALFFWLRRRILISEHKNRDYVEEIRRFDAVRTTTPSSQAEAKAREKGLKTVSMQFSMVKSLILPSFLVLFFIILIIPLLGRISATMVSLLVGVVGVIVGIAAKPPLENLIGGTILTLTKTVRVGDTVLIDNLFGTIEDITTTHTLVKVWDWRRFLIPNSQMLNKAFINYSLIDCYQWAYVEFWVAPDSDIEMVKRIALASPLDSQFYAKYEDPKFWIMQTDKDGVKCWVAAWADNPSAAWYLTHDMRTHMLQEFRKNRIKTQLMQHQFTKIDPNAYSTA